MPFIPFFTHPKLFYLTFVYFHYPFVSLVEENLPDLIFGISIFLFLQKKRIHSDWLLLLNQYADPYHMFESNILQVVSSINSP